MRCVSSLEGLQIKDIYILFVNDGFVDSTKQMIDRWIVKCQNAFLINKENGDYCSTINTGLDNCSSEYVICSVFGC